MSLAGSRLADRFVAQKTCGVTSVPQQIKLAAAHSNETDVCFLARRCTLFRCFKRSENDGRLRCRFTVSFQMMDLCIWICCTDDIMRGQCTSPGLRSGSLFCMLWENFNCKVLFPVFSSGEFLFRLPWQKWHETGACNGTSRVYSFWLLKVVVNLLVWRLRV